MRKIWLIFFLSLALFGEDTNLTETNTSSPKYHWVTQDGEPSWQLHLLLKKIEDDETILCKDRLQTQIVKLKSAIRKKEPLAIDRLANTVESGYLQIRNRGCYDPALFLEENFLPPRKPTIEGELDSPILQRLYVALQKYENLRQETKRWEPIELEDRLYLSPGAVDEAIPKIRRRLYIEGFYPKDDCNSTLYDKDMVKAVKDFQYHHGLKDDGVIGPMTLSAMNESLERKIERIKINIERARWFLQPEEYFVFVNIPGFFMQVYEDGKPIFRSKVIVGRKKRPTPQMRNLISYCVLNPYWRAPKTILKEDIIPSLKKGDFEHLKEEGIIASTDYYGKEVVDFEDVDWEYFDEESMPFTFLQTPGPHNFLGYVKFMFPNRFDVYLHDTNARNLFKYSYRALSSGCVRVKKPIELLHLFLNRTKEVDYRDILDMLWTKQTQKLPIRPNIPVYLLYLSVWMDDNEEVFFYPDIYGIDKKMLAFLHR